LRRWNDVHAKEGTLRYGQALLDASDAMDVEHDRARYEADRAKDLALTRTHGIDAAMDAHRLDALLFAGSGNSDVAARAGYPSVMVPYGLVELPAEPPLPAGAAAKPVPFAIRFTGRACDEPKLIALAYAFEQATKARVVPQP
jgi:amidase